MNFLRVSFTAASHKTFRHMLRSGVSSNVNIMIRSFAAAAGNLESEQVVEKMNRRGPAVLDRFGDAYRVLNERFVKYKDVLRWLRNDYGMRRDDVLYCLDKDRELSWLLQRLSDEVTYTSLMNAYLDEGRWDDATTLFHHVQYFDSLPYLYSVFINGLNYKTRTTEINKYLLRFNYQNCFDRPILEYHSTMVPNSSYDEFKSVVELVEGNCIKGLQNIFNTMLKSNYKHGIDYGIVYNLFIIAHCERDNVDEAYIIYKEMVHYGFACHMFTVLRLIKTLKGKNMVSELLWVIQNVFRSCNLNDSEIVKFLNEFNPKQPDCEAFFDVLAENAKNGLFLKCS